MGKLKGASDFPSQFVCIGSGSFVERDGKRDIYIYIYIHIESVNFSIQNLKTAIPFAQGVKNYLDDLKAIDSRLSRIVFNSL